MSNSTPAPDPTPTPTPASKRAKRGFIDQAVEDNITLAGKCQQEAAKVDVAPLVELREWTLEKQTNLTASLGRCDGYINNLRALRVASEDSTDDEAKARLALLIGLDPIVKGARRKYPSGAPERAAYGVGANLSSASTADLYTAAVYSAAQLSPGTGNTPPKDILPGVRATEITVIAQLAETYKTANFAQSDAQKDSAKLLSQLHQEVDITLNPLRRDLQGAADQAFTHRDPTNAAQRKAFGLQPDRSLNT